jgi:hypothetical protein
MSNPDGRPLRYTPDQVIDALAETAGIQRIAAQRLGCDRNTVTAYIQRFPEIREALTRIQEGTLDLAEATLIQAIRGGHVGATIYYLKTKGKRRGYTEKIEAELSIPNGGTVQVTVWSDLLLEVNGDAADDDTGGGDEPRPEELH